MDSCDSHGRSKYDGQNFRHSANRVPLPLNLAQGLFLYGSLQ